VIQIFVNTFAKILLATAWMDGWIDEWMDGCVSHKI
jgi:hypothetical protein